MHSHNSNGCNPSYYGLHLKTLLWQIDDSFNWNLFFLCVKLNILNTHFSLNFTCKTGGALLQVYKQKQTMMYSAGGVYNFTCLPTASSFLHYFLLSPTSLHHCSSLTHSSFPNLPMVRSLSLRKIARISGTLIISTTYLFLGV